MNPANAGGVACSRAAATKAATRPVSSQWRSCYSQLHAIASSRSQEGGSLMRGWSKRRSAAAKAELQDLALRREQDERNKQECRALALEEIDSKCRGCKQCNEMDYVIHGPDADLMCSKHAKQYEEIVNKKIRRGH